jgi:hypothetical protein
VRNGQVRVQKPETRRQNGGGEFTTKTPRHEAEGRTAKGAKIAKIAKSGPNPGTPEPLNPGPLVSTTKAQRGAVTGGGLVQVILTAERKKAEAGQVKLIAGRKFHADRCEARRRLARTRAASSAAKAEP